MRILLITNLASGVSNRLQVDLTSWLAQCAGHTVTVAAPASAAESSETARRGVAEGYDRIIAAGGDGTINCVASALAGTKVPLGILPIGTVNVLARELDIPLNPLDALHVALNGTVSQVDLGMANGRYFTLMAGMGFDATVVEEMVPRFKEIFGSLAYVTTGMQVLTRFKLSHYLLEINGETIRLPAWLIVVSNASFYAYEFPIAAEARMDDGLLDIIIFGEQTALDRLTQIGAIIVGQHIHHPNVRYLQAPALTISADPPVALQLDGDSAGSSPVEFTVHHRALCVMTPAVPSRQRSARDSAKDRG
ncbi:MAG: diacylglycerol/lipid kinase family protein [Armatimonadota bacterium]